MARIQTMILPGPADDYSFLLIIDQASAPEMSELGAQVAMGELVKRCGARDILLTESTVDVA